MYVDKAYLMLVNGANSVVTTDEECGEGTVKVYSGTFANIDLNDEGALKAVKNWFAFAQLKECNVEELIKEAPTAEYSVEEFDDDIIGGFLDDYSSYLVYDSSDTRSTVAEYFENYKAGKIDAADIEVYEGSENDYYHYGFHSSYCEYLGDLKDFDEFYRKVVVDHYVDEEEYNNTVMVDSGCDYLDFAEEYGNKNAYVYCLMVKAE